MAGVSIISGSHDIGDVRIHFRTAGDEAAPAILLIHGYPETSLAWRRTVGPLVSAGFRLIMPDLRGAGGSSRPLSGYDKSTLAADLAAVVQHLEIKSPLTVVGHDIGLMVAYAFARQFPALTARLVLIDAPLPGTALFDEVWSGSRAWHFHFHQARDVPEALTAGREAYYLERYYHDLAFDPEAIDAETFRAYIRAFSQPGAMRAGFELYRTFGRDAETNRRSLAADGKLRLPVLAMAGAAGSYSETIAPMACEVCENVQLVVIPRAGHWIAEENPEALAEALIEFARAEL